MNKQFLTRVGIMVVSLVASAQLASADYIVATVGGYGPWQTDRGGEFTLLANGGPNLSAYVGGKTSNIEQNDTFQTFCLEKNEYIEKNTLYYATISGAALRGGNNTNLGDPISQGTAWLYSQFAKGTLTGYDYDTETGRHASAAALQNTIWWLEDEDTAAPDNIFTTAVNIQFGTTNAKNDYNGKGVSVLNIWGDAGHTVYKQDMLIATPTPIPAAAWLLGSGILGLVGVRRKMRA